MRELRQLVKKFGKPCRAVRYSHSIFQKIAKTVAIIYLLLPSSFSWGKDANITAKYSAAYHRCYKDSRASEKDLINCAAMEQSKWDNRLNAAYQTLTIGSASSPRNKSKLSEAQQHWLVFKDKWCDVSAAIDMAIDLPAQTDDIPPETGYKTARADCVLKLTAQRTIQLEAASEMQKKNNSYRSKPSR